MKVSASKFSQTMVFVLHLLSVFFLCISFIVRGPCPFKDDFNCGSGRCVRSDRVCNGEFDCNNKKDELNCGNY